MAKILRDKGTVKELKTIFGVSHPTVLSALDGKTKSELANRIRKKALEMGCQVKGSETIKYL
jgi:hypothetical protein